MPHPIAILLAQSDPSRGAGDAVDRAFSLVEALPLEAHAAVGILLIAGLALWLFGGKVVKPLFALIGLALGGMVGLFVVPLLGMAEIAGAPASLVGMGIGAVIGLIIALVLLKVAVVFAAGLGFAVAGFLGAAIYLEHNPLPSENPPPLVLDDETPRTPEGRRLFKHPLTGEAMTIDELTRTLRETERVLRGRDPAAAPPPEQARQERFEVIAVRVHAVLAEALDTARAHINALSARERVVVFGSTFGGLALGLLVGFLMPKRSTAAITALAGSALWLFSAVWLIDALRPEWNRLTTHPPETWGMVWAFLFLVGLVAQLAGLGKTKGSGSKPAKDDADDEEEEEE